MIPVGLCQCGCGEHTAIATKTSTRHGVMRGQPLRFIHNHHRRGYLGPRTTFTEEDHGYATACHIWQGYIMPNGYGSRWSALRRTQTSAHVVAWEAVNGRIPQGLELDHLCRVRACVRPDHLELVTHAENCRRGSMTKLTLALAREIRARKGTARQRDIAKELGVTLSQVADIHAGRKWRGA